MKSKRLAMVLALCLSTVGFAVTASASPLPNTEEGQVSVEVGTHPTPHYRAIINGQEDKGNAKVGYDIKANFGLGNNLTARYGYDYTDIGSSDIKTHQLDLIYKMTPKVAVTAGYAQANFDRADKKSFTTIGAIYQEPLSEKTDAFVEGKLGNDIRKLDLGLAYKVSSDTKLIAKYNYNKYSDMKDDLLAINEYEQNGFSFGVIYKF